MPGVMQTNSADAGFAERSVNDRLKFLGSIGVPYRVVKTKSESDHSSPAACMAASCPFLWS